MAIVQARAAARASGDTPFERCSNADVKAARARQLRVVTDVLEDMVSGSFAPVGPSV